MKSSVIRTPYLIYPITLINTDDSGRGIPAVIVIDIINTVTIIIAKFLNVLLKVLLVYIGLSNIGRSRKPQYFNDNGH